MTEETGQGSEEEQAARKAAAFDPLGPDAGKARTNQANIVELETNAPLIGSFFERAAATMRLRCENTAKAIETPWPNVNDALGGGFWPGVYVLVGGTGMGKTQFALQTAWKTALAGIPTLYLGLEMGEVDVTARVLALAEREVNTKSTLHWSSLFLGKKTTDEFDLLLAAHRPTLERIPLRCEFGEARAWKCSNLRPRVAAMRAGYPESPNVKGESLPGSKPILVVLDFLQVIGGENERQEDIRQRIANAAYAARGVAREHGAAVLLLSSVSRENAFRLKVGGKTQGPRSSSSEATTPGVTPPSEFVGMGKESGEIEYSADAVMALVSGEFEKGKPTPMHLAVAKGRAVTPGWCDLEFDGTTFVEAKKASSRKGEETRSKSDTEAVKPSRTEPIEYDSDA